MRITKLQAENFKRLRAVDITPAGDAVVIGGRNAQGKSSVLDAIMAALSGKRGAKNLTRPIRDGESRASVVVELDDLRVERRWTHAGSTVTVGPRDGSARYNSPQSILDKLLGELAFDPLAFAQADAKSQVDMIIDIIGRENFDRIAAAHKEAYESRTIVNREVRKLRARLLDPVPSSAAPAERVDLGEVNRELLVAHKREALRAEWVKLCAELKMIEDAAQSLPEARSIEDLTSLLETAEAANRQADEYERVQELREQLHEAERESDRLSDTLTRLAGEKDDLIRHSQLPVPGLSFDEEGVSLNGIPFIQASAAERLRTSVAMAMAMNPELRVILIRDASLLDADSRQAITDLAREQDYQIWLEVVGDPGEIGVIIEDGAVAAP